MKMSRKIMCLLGSSLLIVALAGCGTTERTQPQDSQQEDQQPGDEQGQAGQQQNKETGFSISVVRTVRVQAVCSERTLDIGKARK